MAPAPFSTCDTHLIPCPSDALPRSLADASGGGSASAQSAVQRGAMDELVHRSAGELVALIRERKLSSRELLEAYLSRIERKNASINAVVTLDVERARA